MFELRLENESANIVNINDGVNYIVLNCSGLNPPAASIFTAKSPNRKGLKYNGSTLNERNIVITIKILGNIEANRNALYAWIDTEQLVKIYYSNGVKNVYCEGHIEECEIDLFTDNEVITLAILCDNPYLKDINDISIDIANIVNQFIFPFAIDVNGIPFSTRNADNITTITNTGAETGAEFIITCSGNVTNITIFDADDTSRQFKINSTFTANSFIIINTDGSPKTCMLHNSDGSVNNILKYVDKNPTWFNIKKGRNSFGFAADSGVINIALTIRYSNKYLGV